jgi:hypothetical protein
LPLQLDFADLLSEDDDGEWETVREDELSPLEEPSVSSAETPFPLITCLHAGEEPGAAPSEWPDSIPACTVAPGRSWLRYAAVVAAASLAVAAALLPIRWPWLAAPMIHSAARGAQAGRVEPGDVRGPDHGRGGRLRRWLMRQRKARATGTRE